MIHVGLSSEEGGGGVGGAAAAGLLDSGGLHRQLPSTASVMSHQPTLAVSALRERTEVEKTAAQLTHVNKLGLFVSLRSGVFHRPPKQIQKAIIYSFLTRFE